MGARDKLNLLYLGGAVVIAALIGLTLNSWGAFCIAALVLVVMAIQAGDIRLARRPPAGRPKRRRRS